MNTPQTDTPHPQAPYFGEPWHNEEGDFEIYRQTQNDAVAYAEGTKTRDRIIVCVNALAGIPDPAEFVRQAKEMREAIKEAYKIIDVLYMDALDNHKESWPRAREWMELWKEVAP